MSAYSTCSDWAADQTPGDPRAKLILMLLAFDIDAGEPGATPSRLASRSGMFVSTTIQALRLLQLFDLVEIDGAVDGVALYAPKGWQE